jgi:CSLREA domain-containing protein
MLVHYILACVLFSTLAWGSVARAADFVVDTTLDSTDSNLGNGLCGNIEGSCSLRAAIQQANALGGGPHTIALGIHSYEVTTVQSVPLGLDEEDAAASGDLDVTSEITITGVSATSTIVEGGGDGTRADRVFHVLLGGHLTLSHVTVRAGRAASVATSLGGGILNQGVLDLSECVIADNEANAGGGLFNDVGTATISECTFSGNDAQDLGFTNAQGGAIFSQGTLNTLEITQSTLSANSADFTGLAIFINGGALTLENSTLSGNLGGADPALVIQNAEVVLTNTTIVANAGVGLSAFSFNETHTLDVANTIVANNGGSDCTISASSPILTITNSLSSDSSCGFDLEDTDPLLDPLADNDGSTLTHLPLPGSPAIDAGAESPCPDVDQRGQPRPEDGDGDTNADCDIGAVEVPEPGALAGGALALGLVAGLARRRA